MTHRVPMLAVLGLVLAGCGSDEPEDGTTTENASTVGMTSGATASDSSGDTTGDTEAEASSGGSEESDGSGGGAVDYEGEIQPIWNGSCSCHLMGDSGEMAAPSLTLNPGQSHAELVGVPSEQADLNRIEPGSAEESYLFLKVTGAHQSVGSGNRMPQIGVLGDEQVAAIEAWILAGAPS